MYVSCNIESVTKGDFVYANRPINMDLVLSFGKSIATPKDVGQTFFTIKFTHSKTHISEWFFNNEKNRDEAFAKLSTLTEVKNVDI